MCRIVICDDDIGFAEQLQAYIQKYCEKEKRQISLKVCTDSEELMESLIRQNVCDLYILDILMPGYSGMELLDMLEEDNIDAEVILLTADTSYAVEACSYKKVFRYIPKEEFRQKMQSALDAFFRKMDGKQKRMTYVIRNKIRCVRFYQEDVVLIHRDGKYAMFVLKDGRKERERCSLSEIYTKLCDPGMVMLDRSYIVNIAHVRRIEPDEVQMDTGDVIRTSRDRIRQLKESFSVYWGELI